MGHGPASLGACSFLLSSGPSTHCALGLKWAGRRGRGGEIEGVKLVESRMTRGRRGHE